MSTICYDIYQDAVQVQEMCALLDRLEAVAMEGKAESQRVQEYKKMVQSNQHVPIIQKLFSESDIVFNKGLDTDITNYFAVLVSLILKIAKKGSLVLDIANKMQENTAEKIKVRLHVLVDLFNVDVDMNRKFTLLVAILNYARVTNQGDALLPQFLSVQEWTKELQLATEKKRELCQAILQLTKNNQQSLEVLSIYLKTFDAETDLVLEASFDTIQQFVLNTIKLPTLYHFDILHLRAITAFKSKPFYKLVEFFSAGNCKAFKDYFSSVNYLVQSDYEYLLEKMRFLTISSLCSAKQVIAFTEISNALEIEVDDVEAWIVDAVSRDLVFVQIDQPQRQIYVRYSAKRSLDEKDWAALGNRIALCQENFVSLLETVRRAKNQAALQVATK